MVAKDGQEVEEDAGREMIKKMDVYAEYIFGKNAQRDHDSDMRDPGGEMYRASQRGGSPRGRGYRGSYRSRGSVRGRGYVKTEDRNW